MNFKSNVTLENNIDLYLGTTASNAGLIYFGDGDTWIGEGISDDRIDIQSGATANNKTSFSAGSVRLGGASFSPTIVYNASNTVPGYTWDTDPDTGVGRTAADAMSFYTGGTAAITLDSSQNVVIPNGTLTVSADTDVTTILGRTAIHSTTADRMMLSHYDQRTSGSKFALMQESGGKTILNSATGQSIFFDHEGVKQWEITSGNLAGIASNTLTVDSDGDATTILGRTKLGAYTSDVMYLSHFDYGNTTSYALRQNANGSTVLNTATTRNIELRIANVVQWTMDGDLTPSSTNALVVSGTAANPSIRANSATQTGFYLDASFVAITQNGNAKYVFYASQFRGVNDASQDLGTTGVKWQNVYLTPTVTTSTSDNILTYGTDGKIEYRTAASLGGEHALGDHTDVNTTGAADNDMLFRSGGDWIDTAGNVTWDGTDFTIVGNLAATTKSFLIEHPLDSTKKLRYGSLEGPEHAVYCRGILKEGNEIQLPDYWSKLVDEDTITVQLTSGNKWQVYYIKKTSIDKIKIGKIGFGFTKVHYTVTAERNDIDKLKVEV